MAQIPQCGYCKGELLITDMGTGDIVECGYCDGTGKDIHARNRSAEIESLRGRWRTLRSQL